ncbi:MAG: glycosyltransferase family 4 protein [Planctomycetota bacterium]
MRVAYLAAGAAGMYCGSCMHDHRLAAALRAAGRDVVLVPLYTPLRTDEDEIAAGPLYYGGLNVYLQQVSGLFRRLPRFIDRVLDARPLLRLISHFAGATQPEQLGELTLGTLAGPHGPQRKELRRLIDGLRPLRPDVVHLPNLMFVGIARALKDALGARIACGLTGEDVFVDRLPEPYRGQAFELIRAGSADCDAFLALTDYYARHATEHFGLPPARVQRITMGIRAADFAAAGSEPRRSEPRPSGSGAAQSEPRRSEPRPSGSGADLPHTDRFLTGAAQIPAQPAFVIGYLARICPEKGVDELVRAFIELHGTGRDCRLRVAGWLGRAERPFLQGLERVLRAAGIPADAWEYVGEPDRAGKIAFLHSLDVLCVPAAYREAKGFYVLEALAAGVPVVQPDHGAFSELIAATGGGLLYPPGDTHALTTALARLMDEPALRRQLAEGGQPAVRNGFTVERMAAEVWAIYERIAAGPGAHAPSGT